MSFPAYEEYKDSGIEWLGEVPEGWEVSRLKHATSRIVDCPHDTPTYNDDGEYLAIRTSDLDDEKLFPEIMKRVDEAEYEHRIRREPVLKDDIVYSREGGRWGHAALVTESDRFCLGQRMMQFRVNEKYDCRYLMCHLNSKNVYRQGDVDTVGAASPHVNVGTICNFRIAVPPLPEQRTIASFLDTETSKIDSLVSEQRRLIELLKEKRQAVISHAVTKGLDPSVPMKDSGIQWLGEVPEHWTVAKFARIAFMQEGPGLRKWQFTDDGTLVICVTNITENGIDFSSFQKFISTEEYEESYKHFTVNRGDILLSSSGNSWGKVAVYDDDEKVMLNTSTIRINALEDGDATRDYLQIALQSIGVREQLGVAMTGSCQPNFGPTHLKTVMVALPPPDEQAEIVKYVEERLETFTQLQAQAERAIELLQERRTALISAAVTGKIDVRGHKPEEAVA
jgi:type I restriction enzyme S subunit